MGAKRNQDDQVDVMEQQGDTSEETVANDVGRIEPEGDEDDAEGDKTGQEEDAD